MVDTRSVGSEIRHLALARPEKPEYDAQQTRLAAAVGAGYRHEVTTVYVEINSRQHPTEPVAESHAAHAYQYKSLLFVHSVRLSTSCIIVLSQSAAMGLNMALRAPVACTMASERPDSSICG